MLRRGGLDQVGSWRFSVGKEVLVGVVASNRDGGDHYHAAHHFGRRGSVPAAFSGSGVGRSGFTLQVSHGGLCSASIVGRRSGVVGIGHDENTFSSMGAFVKPFKKAGSITLSFVLGVLTQGSHM
jgi:hypothetical protein